MGDVADLFGGPTTQRKPSGSSGGPGGGFMMAREAGDASALFGGPPASGGAAAAPRSMPAALSRPTANIRDAGDAASLFAAPASAGSASTSSFSSSSSNASTARRPPLSSSGSLKTGAAFFDGFAPPSTVREVSDSPFAVRKGSPPSTSSSAVASGKPPASAPAAAGASFFDALSGDVGKDPLLESLGDRSKVTVTRPRATPTTVAKSSFIENDVSTLFAPVKNAAAILASPFTDAAPVSVGAGPADSWSDASSFFDQVSDVASVVDAAPAFGLSPSVAETRPGPHAAQGSFHQPEAPDNSASSFDTLSSGHTSDAAATLRTQDGSAFFDKVSTHDDDPNFSDRIPTHADGSGSWGGMSNVAPHEDEATFDEIPAQDDGSALLSGDSKVASEIDESNFIGQMPTQDDGLAFFDEVSKDDNGSNFFDQMSSLPATDGGYADFSQVPVCSRKDTDFSKFAQGEFVAADSSGTAADLSEDAADPSEDLDYPVQYAQSVAASSQGNGFAQFSQLPVGKSTSGSFIGKTHVARLRESDDAPPENRSGAAFFDQIPAEDETGSNFFDQVSIGASSRLGDFATQLQQMEDLGLTDRAENISALKRTQGNVNAAIERLLGGDVLDQGEDVFQPETDKTFVDLQSCFDKLNLDEYDGPSGRPNDALNFDEHDGPSGRPNDAFNFEEYDGPCGRPIDTVNLDEFDRAVGSNDEDSGSTREAVSQTTHEDSFSAFTPAPDGVSNPSARHAQQNQEPGGSDFFDKLSADVVPSKNPVASDPSSPLAVGMASDFAGVPDSSKSGADFFDSYSQNNANSGSSFFDQLSTQDVFSAGRTEMAESTQRDVVEEDSRVPGARDIEAESSFGGALAPPFETKVVHPPSSVQSTKAQAPVNIFQPVGSRSGADFFDTISADDRVDVGDESSSYSGHQPSAFGRSAHVPFASSPAAVTTPTKTFVPVTQPPDPVFISAAGFVPVAQQAPVVATIGAPPIKTFVPVAQVLPVASPLATAKPAVERVPPPDFHTFVSPSPPFVSPLAHVMIPPPPLVGQAPHRPFSTHDLSAGPTPAAVILTPMVPKQESATQYEHPRSVDFADPFFPPSTLRPTHQKTLSADHTRDELRVSSFHAMAQSSSSSDAYRMTMEQPKCRCSFGFGGKVVVAKSGPISANATANDSLIQVRALRSCLRVDDPYRKIPELMQRLCSVPGFSRAVGDQAAASKDLEKLLEEFESMTTFRAFNQQVSVADADADAALLVRTLLVTFRRNAAQNAQKDKKSEKSAKSFWPFGKKGGEDDAVREHDALGELSDLLRPLTIPDAAGLTDERSLVILRVIDIICKSQSITDAIEFAQRQGHVDIALALSLAHDKVLPQGAQSSSALVSVLQVMSKEIPHTSALLPFKSLLEAMTGKNHLPHDSSNHNCLAWRVALIICAVAFGPGSKEFSRVAGNFGDSLWSAHHNVKQAHSCYILAGNFQSRSFDDPNARVVLLGSDHKRSPRVFATGTSLFYGTCLSSITDILFQGRANAIAPYLVLSCASLAADFGCFKAAKVLQSRAVSAVTAAAVLSSRSAAARPRANSAPGAAQPPAAQPPSPLLVAAAEEWGHRITFAARLRGINIDESSTETVSAAEPQTHLSAAGKFVGGFLHKAIFGEDLVPTPNPGMRPVPGPRSQGAAPSRTQDAATHRRTASDSMRSIGSSEPVVPASGSVAAASPQLTTSVGVPLSRPEPQVPVIPAAASRTPTFVPVGVSASFAPVAAPSSSVPVSTVPVAAPAWSVPLTAPASFVPIGASGAVPPETRPNVASGALSSVQPISSPSVYSQVPGPALLDPLAALGLTPGPVTSPFPSKPASSVSAPTQPALGGVQPLARTSPFGTAPMTAPLSPFTPVQPVSFVQPSAVPVQTHVAPVQPLDHTKSSVSGPVMLNPLGSMGLNSTNPPMLNPSMPPVSAVGFAQPSPVHPPQFLNPLSSSVGPSVGPQSSYNAPPQVLNPLASSVGSVGPYSQPLNPLASSVGPTGSTPSPFPPPNQFSKSVGAPVNSFMIDDEGSNPPTPKKSEPKQSAANSPGLLARAGSWFSWSSKKQVDLGEDNQMEYNKELKRWVKRGMSKEEVAQLMQESQRKAAPPPMTGMGPGWGSQSTPATAQTAIPQSSGSPAERGQGADAGPGAAPPGMGPPGGNMFQTGAGSRRKRYVDTFHDGDSAPGSSGPPAPKAAVATPFGVNPALAGAAPKPFVPLVPRSDETS